MCLPRGSARHTAPRPHLRRPMPSSVCHRQRTRTAVRRAQRRASFRRRCQRSGPGPGDRAGEGTAVLDRPSTPEPRRGGRRRGTGRRWVGARSATEWRERRSAPPGGPTQRRTSAADGLRASRRIGPPTAGRSGPLPRSEPAAADAHCPLGIARRSRRRAPPPAQSVRRRCGGGGPPDLSPDSGASSSSPQPGSPRAPPRSRSRLAAPRRGCQKASSRRTVAGP